VVFCLLLETVEFAKLLYETDVTKQAASDSWLWPNLFFSVCVLFSEKENSFLFSNTITGFVLNQTRTSLKPTGNPDGSPDLPQTL
jgi:hypothetical protein